MGDDQIMFYDVVQYGFAGVCSALLFMIYTYMKNIFHTLDRFVNIYDKQVESLAALSKSIQCNTDAITMLSAELRKRPCLFDKV